MTIIIKNLLIIIFFGYSTNVFSQEKRCVMLEVENKSKVSIVVPNFDLGLYYKIIDTKSKEDTLFLNIISVNDTTEARGEGTVYVVGKLRTLVFSKKRRETMFCIDDSLFNDFFFVYIDYDNYLYIYKRKGKTSIYTLKIDTKYIKENWADSIP